MRLSCPYSSVFSLCCASVKLLWTHTLYSFKSWNEMWITPTFWTLFLTQFPNCFHTVRILLSIYFHAPLATRKVISDVSCSSVKFKSAHRVAESVVVRGMLGKRKRIFHSPIAIYLDPLRWISLLLFLIFYWKSSIFPIFIFMFCSRFWFRFPFSGRRKRVCNVLVERMKWRTLWQCEFVDDHHRLMWDEIELWIPLHPCFQWNVFWSLFHAFLTVVFSLM